jgi:peptide deformylase
MLWRPKLDRDAAKEIWLLFENGDGRFPLYPGQRATIEYSYTVGQDKWGHWFQRAVRLPTRRLSVRIDFPAELKAVMWGVETSLTAEAGPLRTPLSEHRDGGRAVFDWSIGDPALNARFRLEWRFRAEARSMVEPAPSGPPRPSELMRRAGIVQRGAAMLERPARWLDLPDQAALATDIVARLLDTLQHLGELHEFGKGIGLAAPQLGIGWAAAVVVSSGDGTPVVLLNPRVVGESVDQDQQYEGCLSFFDVRGLVSRPLVVELEHEDLTGAATVTTFTNAMARLVAHEVDHLGGLLYSDRMPPDRPLTPVEEYREHGRPWRY